MKPSDKPRLGKDEPPPKPSRSEEARRIIEEYANHLREIIKNSDVACIEAMTARP